MSIIASSLRMQLVDPTSRKPFPSTELSDRRAVAMPFDVPYAILISGLQVVLNAHRRAEIVTAVDGRNVINNSGSMLCTPPRRHTQPTCC